MKQKKDVHETHIRKCEFLYNLRNVQSKKNTQNKKTDELYFDGYSDGYLDCLTQLGIRWQVHEGKLSIVGERYRLML